MSTERPPLVAAPPPVRPLHELAEDVEQALGGLLQMQLEVRRRLAVMGPDAVTAAGGTAEDLCWSIEDALHLARSQRRRVVQLPGHVHLWTIPDEGFGARCPCGATRIEVERRGAP